MTQLRLLARQIPHAKRIGAARDALRIEAEFVPPGHFYSPVPALSQVRADSARIFRVPDRNLAGIDMNEQQQLELLKSFEPLYDELPFLPQATEGFRYRYENEAYSYSDAIFLYCMIRQAQPRRIVEVGSGWSSCAILDTNERFFDNRIETVFVEPYPQLLHSLISAADLDRIRVLPQRLQDVPLEEFTRLQAGDILFIDSTHVSKVFSDVNVLFFDVLPRLQPGVFVHFHDIFYPFEYPESWIMQGRAWNEAYLLRAFMQFNAGFRVVLMNTFLEQFHREYFERRMPLCLKNLGGSIWLQRT